MTCPFISTNFPGIALNRNTGWGKGQKCTKLSPGHTDLREILKQKGAPRESAVKGWQIFKMATTSP